MSTTPVQATTMSADDIRRAMQGIDWWHDVDLGHGIVAPGRGGNTRLQFERINMPADLSGKSVLDIGAWDGYYSFEAEKRGAARIVALNEKEKPGLELARRVRNSKVEQVTLDLMELTPQAVGTFDVVLFLGVLYHLPNPLEGLRRVFEVTDEMMIMETDTRLNWVPFPAARLVEDSRGIEDYDRNWWRPNWRAVLSMCKQVGFRRAEIAYKPAGALDRALAHRLRQVSWRLYPERSMRCTVHAWK